LIGFFVLEVTDRSAADLLGIQPIRRFFSTRKAGRETPSQHSKLCEIGVKFET